MPSLRDFFIGPWRAVTVLGVMSVARFESAGWPRFVTTGFHRNLSLLAVIFLGLHIVTAVVDPYTSLGWASAVIPFSSSYRTLWLGLGTVAIAMTGDIKLWTIYVSVVLLSAKLAAFAIQYVAFRVLVTSRIRASRAAAGA